MEQKRFDIPVLESIEQVVAKSRHVRYHPEMIPVALADFKKLPLESTGWHHPCHFFDGTERTVKWIFILDVLNHCFWPDPGEPAWSIDYAGQDYSGYWGLAACLKKAHERSVPITDPSWLADLSAPVLRDIFAGTGKIPLFEERLANLRETGEVILSRWQGNIVHLIEEANGFASTAVNLIVSSFPSFRDEALYQGRRVFFWKRAQLFVSDLNSAFSGKGWGQFVDMEVLTAFADYKLPQVLRELGVISYTNDLAERIDRLELIDPGSEEEVEIRAMTIKAVEGLKDAFKQAGIHASSALIDSWLWQMGQLAPFRKRPYHRCRTIYY